MQRRQLLSLLSLASALRAMPLLAQSEPEWAGIAWVRLGVPDPVRTLQFYAGLFGSGLRRTADGTADCLQLGNSLLLVQAAPEPSVLEHNLQLKTPGIVQWQRHLQELGIRAQQAADGRLLLRDGDGVQTRIGSALDWQALTPSTHAVPSAGKPLFEALLIDEIFLSVTNMQVDSMFYARLLDQTSVAVAGSQYFRLGAHAQLRLGQAATGQAPGFMHFSVLVANTDMEAAAEAVFRAGGVVESFLPNGFSFWDPDGLRVLVRSVPQVLGSSSR